MTNFLVLYRGRTISEAKMIAVTIDPDIIAFVIDSMANDNDETADIDPALACVEGGRRQALRLIRREATNASS